MLTKRENFLETLRGGSPDRYVNQYDYLGIVMTPIGGDAYARLRPGMALKNDWGVTLMFQEGTPGPFPMLDDEHKVLHDVTMWKDVVKAPETNLPDEAWGFTYGMMSQLDRNEVLVTPMIAPGIFETVHYLMGMEDAMIALYEEPEAMHDLIDYITEYEMRMAEQIVNRIHPDALFHHDDWGSHKSSFLSPEMFREFFLEPYKKIYGFYKDNGVQAIIHHNDAYSANLMPEMIEMGINVWQGAVDTNNIPELLKQYGPQLTIMGGINNGKVDTPNWTPELVAAEVEKVCRECGTKYFIPCLTQGMSGSTFPGVYECVTENIDRMSKIMF